MIDKLLVDPQPSRKQTNHFTDSASPQSKMMLSFQARYPPKKFFTGIVIDNMHPYLISNGSQT